MAAAVVCHCSAMGGGLWSPNRCHLDTTCNERRWLPTEGREDDTAFCVWCAWALYLRGSYRQLSLW